MASSSQALVSQKTDQPVSLNRQAVLDEDEYTSALSTIIARDFFPSLEHLDATNSYLSALESRDADQIDASARRLSSLATPGSNSWNGATPRGGPSTDTPMRTPRQATKRPKYDTRLSLDEFQARYTSEDNASFTEILDDENWKRKERWGWAWEAEKRANDSKRKEVEGRRVLLLETQTLVEESARRIGAAEQRKAIMDAPSGDTEDITESDEDEAAVEMSMVVRNSPPPRSPKPPQQQVDVMAPLKDTRSAAVPGWSFKNRNALMFAPDADVSPYHPPPPATADSIPESARGDPKAINHASTRLPQPTDDAQPHTVPPSPSRSYIEAAITGTPYRPHADEPNVQGFGFVSALPSPSPSQLGPDRMKELMTWGMVQGTPRVIQESSDIPNPDTPFRIAAPSSRDALGRRLGVSASKSMRKRASMHTPRPVATPGNFRSNVMGPPSATPRRSVDVDLLSPAGRNLLDRTKGFGIISGSSHGWDGSTTPLRRVKGRELDLRKVGWSPREADSPGGKR